MAKPAVDDFTGASGPLSGSWTQQKTSFTLDRDGSGAVASTGAGDAFAFWNADGFDNDQYAEAVIDSGLASGSGYAQVTVRCSTDAGDAAWDGYVGFTDGVTGAAHLEITKSVNGSQTTLGSFAGTFTSGDALKLAAVGSVIELFKNGASLGTVSDATFTSGFPGAGAYGSGKLASFEADDTTPAQQPVRNRRLATQQRMVA